MWKSKRILRHCLRLATNL
jgi:hypothetical protein